MSNWVRVVNKLPYVALDLVHFSIPGAMPPNIPSCKAFAQTLFNIFHLFFFGHRAIVSMMLGNHGGSYLLFFRLVYGREDLAVE